MKTSTRRTQAQRTEETRERILESARELFVKRGYHATSLEQVADAAGYTKGAVFSRFKNKGDLFLCLLDRSVTQRAANVRAIAALSGDPIALARSLYRQWTTGVHADSDWTLLVLEFRIHAARNPELNMGYAKIYETVRNNLGEVILENFRRAGINMKMRGQDIARLIMALGNGELLERRVDGKAYPSAEMEEMIVGIMKSVMPPSDPQSITKASSKKRGAAPAKRDEKAQA